MLARQVFEHFFRAVVAKLRIRFEAFENDALEVARDIGIRLAWRGSLRLNSRDDLRDRRVAFERRFAGEKLVENHAERVEVRLGVRGLTFDLLGGDVIGGSHHLARARHRRRVGGASDAEVHDPDDPAAVDHDVLRLEVPVHHALAVGFGEAAQHLLHERQRLGDGDFFFLVQHLAQVRPFDELHGEELRPLELAEVVDADDVLVGDFAREDQLLLEALENFAARALLGADRLERHRPVELEIERFVDAAHAAFAEFLEDSIAIAESEQSR